MKDYSKKVGSIVAAMGCIVYLMGLYYFRQNQLMVILFTVAGISLMLNKTVYDVVQACRAEHRFAWNRKEVRTGLLWLFGVMILGVAVAFI